MNQIFVRSEQLHEKIYTIKLHIPEWKVLFAIDGQMGINQIADFLEMELGEVKKALSELKKLDLVVSGGGAEPETPEMPSIAVESPEPSAAETAEVMPEEMLEELSPEPAPEPAESGAPALEESEITSRITDQLTEEEQKEVIEFDFPAPEAETSAPSEEIGEEYEELKIDEGFITEPQSKPDAGEQDLDSLINDLLKEESDSEEGEKGPKILDEGEIAAWDSAEELSKTGEQAAAPDELISTTEETPDVTLDDIITEEETASVAEKIQEEVEMFTPAPAEGHKTILVVDDSIVIRKMVEIALENESYNVVSVSTGKEAFAFLDDKEPDLVILDIMLPDVNGLDILRTIKAKKNIPVVMLSAKDTPKETSKAKELGADDFIPKPFRDEELVSKIHELIGQ